MKPLENVLQAYDIAFLKIIANRWDVDLESKETPQAARQLAQAMLDPARAEHEWGRLTERERGALQVLLGSPQHKMPLAHYNRMYTEIREVGPDALTRDKPHLNPNGVGEILYYRGFLGIDFAEGNAGLQKFVFVPTDLAAILPTHQTGYDLSAEDELDAPENETVTLIEGELDVHKADTTLIDDLTTFLAYLQVQQIPLDQSYISLEHQDAILEYSLGPQLTVRLNFIVTLCQELKLILTDADGFLKPASQPAKDWLDKPRTEQVRLLVEAWERTRFFNELWFVEGLKLNYDKLTNDPVLGRKIIKRFLTDKPSDNWFSIAELIEQVKAQEPDFQRPGGHYDTWHIRSAETETYMSSFDYWDQIDGAMLGVILGGPLHWLGLLDLAYQEDVAMGRLNAFGRAFVGLEDWPRFKDPQASLEISPNALISVSRHVSRYDRFQVARFTDWGAPHDPFEYAISKESMRAAIDQGIKPDHILAFLKRVSNQPLPAGVVKGLERWKLADNPPLVLGQMTILQSETRETLDQIWNNVDLRRFLGKRLGDRAVIVQAERAEELAQALDALNIPFVYADED